MPSPVRWPRNLTHPEVAQLASALRERMDPLLERTLERGLYVGQHLAAYVTTVEVTAPDDWAALSLTNGFTRHANTDFLAPATRIDEAGNLWVRGLVTRGAGAPAAGTVIAPWPTGYAPAGTERLETVGDSPIASAGIQLDATGVVYLYGSVAALSLRGAPVESSGRTPPDWATPLTVVLPSTFPRAPQGVEVWACTDKASGAAVAATLPWTATRVGNLHAITAPHVNGLSPGTTYNLTLAVYAG